MKHTPECDAMFEKLNKEIEAYKRRWPNFCRDCAGFGYFMLPYHGPSTMMEQELCPLCTEKGICPRCGRESYDSEKDNCYECNFNLKIGGIIGHNDDCACFDEELNKLSNEGE